MSLIVSGESVKEVFSFPRPPTCEKFISHRLMIVLIPLVALIGYFPTLRAPFIYDDKSLIVENESIKSLAHPERFFIERKSFSAKNDFIIYRPLATLSFALNYALGKFNPMGYHLVNLLLHAINGILLFYLLRLILKNSLLSLIAALLFVCHPLQTEAISWISGRCNGLFLLFYLLSFICFVRWRQGERAMTGYFISLAGYALALLSKEMAVLLPAVLLVYDYHFLPRNTVSIKKQIKIYLPFLFIAVAYLLIRYNVLGRTSQTGYWGGGIFPTVLTMSKAVVFWYLQLAFLPVRLSVDHLVPLSFSIREPWVLISFLVILGIAIGTMLLYKRNRYLSFGVFWFFLNFLPVSNLIPLQAIAAERFLYLPIIGFLIVLVWGIHRLVTNHAPPNLNRPALLTIFPGLLVFYSAVSIHRNFQWADEYAFWSSTLKVSPCSVPAHINLGLWYHEKGEYDKAVEEYLIAIKYDPNRAIAHSNLGDTYQKKGLYAEAIREYVIAAGITPDLFEAYNNSGNAYKRQGNFAQAIEQYKKAIEVRPDYVDAHFNLGVTYDAAGQADRAINEYLRAIELRPAYAQAYNNVAVVYMKLGKLTEAINYYEAAVKADYSYIPAHYNLALTYESVDPEKMIAELKVVISLDSTFAQAHYNLGVAYERKGMYPQAAEAYQKEIEVNPAHLLPTRTWGCCIIKN